MIELREISVSYQDMIVLNHINLSFEMSNIIGIIGPNGAGKSTLLKSIVHMIPHTGEVYLDGERFYRQAGKVAYVEQKSTIDFHFPITVKECVSLGLYKKVKLFHRLRQKEWEKVREALDLVKMTEYANRQISQLSGGQFQRVLIARCLVQEADYIFLDEPFVGVDSVSEEIIMNTLRQLKEQGKLILIVHHDLAKVRAYFDQVLLLNRKVIAFGNTADVFTKEYLLETYGEGIVMIGADQ